MVSSSAAFFGGVPRTSKFPDQKGNKHNQFIMWDLKSTSMVLAQRIENCVCESPEKRGTRSYQVIFLIFGPPMSSFYHCFYLFSDSIGTVRITRFVLVMHLLVASIDYVCKLDLGWSSIKWPDALESGHSFLKHRTFCVQHLLCANQSQHTIKPIFTFLQK